jgi:hypothetical protein
LSKPKQRDKGSGKEQYHVQSKNYWNWVDRINFDVEFYRYRMCALPWSSQTASPSSTAGDRTTSAGDRETPADPAGAGKASSRQTGVSASSSGKTHAAKGQGGQTGGRPAAPSITAAGSTKIQETVKRPTPAYRTSAY